MSKFDYKEAFSRNIGWITESEQSTIAQKRVAIAGVGGVGGHYAEILTRLGVSKFHLSDFDEFETTNFNRQNGSGISTVGEKKLEVIRDKILDINPLADIQLFPDGINELNIEEFLDSTDVYLDGLDFFALNIRRLIFSRAHRLNIPALTIAPVGAGASLIVFTKHSQSFEYHFGIQNNDTEEESAIKFLIGLTPTLKQAKYLVDKTKTNFSKKIAPSLPIGPYLCAGIAGAEVIKIFLNRGNVCISPWVLHFDAYLQSYSKSYLWLGHKNIFQKIKYKQVKKILTKQK